MKKFILFAFAALFSVASYAYEPMWKRLNATFAVTGGSGIEQFVKAVKPLSDLPMDSENIDRKNGYYQFFEEGDGHVLYHAALWNRADGRKLFIVAYDITESMPSEPTDAVISPWGYSALQYEIASVNYLDDTGCMAYLYDAAKKQLVPLSTPPFNGLDLNTPRHFTLKLPQKGKDIAVRESLTHEIYTYHTLKWNGTAFNFVPAPSPLLSLYITDPDPKGTNFRDAPAGNVACTLPASGAYNLFIDEIRNGWCHIVGDVVYDNLSESDSQFLEGSTNGYWIHSSVIGGSGMGEGGVSLRNQPVDGAKVIFTSTEHTIVHPLEIRGEWVKVYVGKNKVQGWLRISDICSNPLTNCC